MTTRLLYREDPYLDRFSATVLECAPKGEHWLAVLDATAFYPEGGGQPADVGTLGGARVLDVRERGGVVEHTVDAPLTPGAAVEGAIDWERRFSLMQHHTGEHIVSGLALALFGVHNVGFHMGAEMVTVDFDGPLDAGQLDRLETLANRAVYANRPVTESFPGAEALAALPYRSKKELTGKVRIITVEGGFDCCACCGVHVARTGEIGCIKLLSPQNYKGGVRFGILCGERALLDYRQKDQTVAAVAGMFSTGQRDAAGAVRRLSQEHDALKHALSHLRRDFFSLRCDAIGPGAETLCLIEDGLSPTDLQQFALLLAERRSGVCAVFSAAESGFCYAVAARDADLRGLARELNAALSGRGGGKPGLVQGTVQAARRQIEDYFSKL